jgi:glycosyltransferase involved in cell wall biosynthesis
MSTTKKICIIGPAYPYKGGIATFNDRMAIELHNMGYEVVVITFKLQYPSIFFPGKSQTTSEIKSFPFPIFRNINAINPLNWYSVGKEIQKADYDLVISRFWIPAMAPSLGWINKIIQGNKKTKITAIVDNLIPHEKRIGDSILSSFFLRSIHSAIAMSASVKYDILQQTNSLKKVALIPHPIYDHYGASKSKNEASDALNLSRDFKYILFFGLIRKYKGLDLLIKAMKSIVAYDSKFKLIVAGEFYDNEESYRNLIVELGLQENVIIYSGFIPDDQVADIFSISELLVLPYRTATQSGISQMAMHFELPMIVTNVGGLPEIVKDGKTGYISDVDSDDMSDKVIKYFSEAKHHEFQKNIIIDKKNYSWKSFAVNLLKFTLK